MNGHLVKWPFFTNLSQVTPRCLAEHSTRFWTYSLSYCLVSWFILTHHKTWLIVALPLFKYPKSHQYLTKTGSWISVASLKIEKNFFQKLPYPPPPAHLTSYFTGVKWATHLSVWPDIINSLGQGYFWRSENCLPWSTQICIEPLNKIVLLGKRKKIEWIGRF